MQPVHIADSNPNYKDNLLALQGELLAARDACARSHLSKAPPSSPDAPFPITLTATLLAPPAAASRFDVTEIELRITILRSILTRPPPPDALHVAVTSSVLPVPLRSAIACRLCVRWQQAAAAAAGDGERTATLPSGSSFAITRLLLDAQYDFVSLISSVPECLELYEATDSSGATQRRYAIVEPPPSCGSSSSSSGGRSSTKGGDHRASEPAGRAQVGSEGGCSETCTTSSPAPVCPHSLCVEQETLVPPASRVQCVQQQQHNNNNNQNARDDLQQQLQNLTCSPTELLNSDAETPGQSTLLLTVRAAGARPPLLRPQLAGPLPGHCLAMQDLAAVQRRYGNALQLHDSAMPTTPDATIQQEMLTAGQQQWSAGAGQQCVPHREQHQHQQVLQQHQQVPPPQCFSLLLSPTDPLWGAARGPLHVLGRLEPAAYPGGENALSLALQHSPGVPEGEVYVLQAALDARAAQLHRGEAWRLRTLLRFLESYAGTVLHDAHTAQQRLLLSMLQPPGTSNSPVRAGAAHRRGTGAVDAAPALLPHAADPSARAGVRVLHAASVRHPVCRVGAASGATTATELGFGRLLRPRHKERTAPGSSSRAHQEGCCGEEGRMGNSSCVATSDDDHSSSGSSSGSGTGDEEEADAPQDELVLCGDAPQDELVLCGDADGGSLSGGFLLLLTGLQLDGIGVLEVVQAQLQLLCGRCSARITLLLSASGGELAAPVAQGSAPALLRNNNTANSGASAGAAAAGASSSLTGGRGDSGTGGGRGPSSSWSWAGACPTCTTRLSLLLRPRLCHGGSNVLAGVMVDGVRPLDMLPSLFGATCANCGAAVALRGLQVGVPASRACSHCHRSLSCSVPGVSFAPRKPPAAIWSAGGQATRSRGGACIGGDRGSGGRRGGERFTVLREGERLPDNGTCKHYRHSYRWLRFPCCGVRYPCDLCHEEAVADGHSAAWASRMVCGFCSREQPLDDTCRHCGKRLATRAALPSGRATHFWEGGQGCRDRRRLDRRDARKHRGSAFKTRSAKASRVGPKTSGSRGGGSNAPS